MSDRRRRHALEDLLRDGHWGAVRLGVPRQLVVRTLGQPDSWQQSETERRALASGQRLAGWALSETLRYGAVEFHFPEDLAGRCWMILCDELDAVTPPFKAGWLAEGLPAAAVRERLEAEGLRWVEEPFPTAPDQVRLLLDSGVRLGLVDDPAFFDTPGEGLRLFCVEQRAALPEPSRGRAGPR